MTIKRREAVRITLVCDVCGDRADVYQGPNQDFEVPEGWDSFPDSRYLVEDAEPRVLLCPSHAHLIPTVRLVESMLRSREQLGHAT